MTPLIPSLDTYFEAYQIVGFGVSGEVERSTVSKIYDVYFKLTAGVEACAH